MQHSLCGNLQASRALQPRFTCFGLPAASTRRKPVLLGQASSQASQETGTREEEFCVWLPSRAVERTVRLDVLPDGKGQAVVVFEVEPGSEAEQAGVVRGQKVTGISDPVQDSKLWDMSTRPSLRFVKDTLKLRRMGQVQLRLKDFKNVTDPNWGVPEPEGVQSLAVKGESNSTSSADGIAQSGQASTVATVATLDTLISGSDSDSEQAFSRGSTPELTVGERMALEYEASQKATQQVNEVQKRIQKRQEYMDIDAQRDDTPLLLGLFAIFVGPAFIILAIAASTGYLDKIYSASLTFN